MVLLLALWVFVPVAAHGASACYPPPCPSTPGAPATAEAQSSPVIVPLDFQGDDNRRQAVQPYVAVGMTMILGTLLVITSLRRMQMARLRRPLERPALLLGVDRRLQSPVRSAPGDHS